MKFYRNILKVSLALLAVAGMSSCTDYLDKAPEAEISAEKAFQNFRNFQGFTEELYMCIPKFDTDYWTNSWNWGEDEIMDPNTNYHMCYKIDNGDFWGWQSEYDGWQSGWMDRGSIKDASDNAASNDRFKKSLWPLAWYGIRKANMGLENFDLLTDATQEEKNIIKGQLHFFRGWFYFELMQFFGGLPYMESSLPENNMPRPTYQECAEKAAADFRTAADLLPVDWDKTTVGKNTLGKNELRINKIMALCYLGKNYLWAASPLMKNGAQVGASKNGKTYDYDMELAKKAAQAFGEALNLVESGQTQYELADFADWSQLQYTWGQGGKIPGLKEAIFRGPSYGGGWGATRWGLCLQWGSLLVSDGGGVSNFPTANYVNYAYGMQNGLALDDPESGFDPTHPWKDRDPRFYADIIYDGREVVKNKSKLESDINDNHKSYTVDDIQFPSLYTGGYLRSPIKGVRTGYINTKFTDAMTSNQWDDGYGWASQINCHISWMRLSDVYLMYAEAVTNGEGTPQAKVGCGLSAIDAVNKVRARAGVDEVASKFTGDKNKFNDVIRRERACELAFEGHRFNDLRRWLLLTEYPYTVKTSQEFQRDGEFDKTDATQNAVRDWREETILTRKFDEKHYWFPLKRSDTNMYPEMEQNPGW